MNSNSLNKLIILILFISLSVFFSRTFHNIDENGVCVHLLQKGEIFEGQPYCGQGIISYIFLFLTQGLSHKIFLAIFLLLHFHAFLLIQKIVKQETGRNQYILVTSAYISLLYLFGGNISSFLAGYFILLGFYIFRFSSIKYNVLLGSMITTLSPLSKATTLPIFIIISFYFVYTSLFRSKRNRILNGFIPIIGFLLVFLMIFAIWPNSFMYEFGVQSSRISESFFSILYEFLISFRFTSGSIILFSMILLSIFSFFFLRDIYSFTSAVYTLILFFILFSQRGLGADTGFIFATNRMDYYAATIPFFIISAAKIRSYFSRNRRLILAFLFFIILLSSIELTISSNDVLNMQEILKSSFSLIPKKADRVLVENPSQDLLKKYYSDEITIDVIPDKINWVLGRGPDPFFSHQLDFINFTNLSEWYTEKDPVIYEKFKKRLKNRFYSLILVGPPQWSILMPMIKNLNGYCIVIIPDLQYPTPAGLHESYLLFRDTSRCNSMIINLRNYFTKYSDYFCKISPFVANKLIRPTLNKESIYFDECKGGKNDALLFLNRESYHIRKLSFFLAFVITLFSWYIDLKWNNTLSKKDRITLK